MHSSSQSIGALAAALAKAQAALVNPEKTMTASIRDDRREQGAERHFRYAPLSNGLEIIRKALGQHEIALVQTTAIDETTRSVRLNSVLAHSSGEWISSDWPVCPLSDIGTPQRMGAALTYARRYALFTLVGIAGEDGLDAPDLSPHAGPGAAGPFVGSGIVAGTKPNGRAEVKPQAAASRRILATDESARLREGMLAEIQSVRSETSATAWATTMLGAKNTLTAEDALSVEAAFETKMLALATHVATDTITGVFSAHNEGDMNGSAEHPPQTIDRHPPITKTVRHRNKEHLKFVGAQPCLICAKQPSDAHHLTFAQPRALGRKVGDEYTVPLCRAHHREVHRLAKEIEWWQARGIAPLAVAEGLWQTSQSGKSLSGPGRQTSEPLPETKSANR